jgi:hypothetical protein
MHFFISGEVSSDLTCKPQTSEYTKKAHHRKSKKLSPGIAVPLTMDSNSEVMLGSSGIQVHDFPKAMPVLSTELTKRNSYHIALASQSITSVEEVLVKKRSEVNHIESSDGNVTVGPTLVADPVSGMKSVSLPSLFDPDAPLTPSGDECKEEAAPKGAMTTFSGDGGASVSDMDNFDFKSTFPNVESSVDMSFYIQNIMEEMRSVPNLLSPLNPEPETGRSHCQSMYYLSLLCLQNF